MFEEPFFVLYCCIPAKFENTRNLLKYVWYTEEVTHIGHIERNISYKWGLSVHYQNNCFRDLLSIQSEMLWLPSRIAQVPLLFRFLYKSCLSNNNLKYKPKSTIQPTPQQELEAEEQPKTCLFPEILKCKRSNTVLEESLVRPTPNPTNKIP